MPNDPKWRTIARVSKQSIPAVISVYIHLLVNASNATERGRTQNVCNEDIASALDLECEQVDVILSAMQGRVLDGDKLSGWSKRQVEREDGGAERAKAWREAKKPPIPEKPNANERKRTKVERKRTPDTDTDTDTDKENNNISSDSSDRTCLRFDEFWNIWPATDRKTQKAKCSSYWKAKNLDSIAETIIVHIAALKITDKWISGYEPAPMTYLNGKLWEDGLPAIIRSPPSSASPGKTKEDARQIAARSIFKDEHLGHLNGVDQYEKAIDAEFTRIYPAS
jgi:hypothetical protein